jgi:uncharacterized protein
MTRTTVARRIATVALVLACGVAQAGYPAPLDNYVNDFAKRLDDGTAYRLRDTLSSLERSSGVEMTVVVIDSVAEYGTGHTAIEPFATALFNRWGVGNTERNDGILLLAAIRDRALRVELGNGYSRAADAVVQEVIDREILPRFRNEDYRGGIRAGVEALALKAKTGALPLASGTSALFDKAIRSVQRFESWPQAGAGLAVLLAVLSAWRYYWRRRPRSCPRCGAAMRRLSEIAEDRFLDPAEKLEERLESVDYDVWLCPSCKATEKIPYRSWTSRYGACPKCNVRALRRSTRVLSHATTTSEGSELVSDDCASCGYHSERTVTIARKQESGSSSSDSSFGGGSSSGGGASGRW